MCIDRMCDCDTHRYLLLLALQTNTIETNKMCLRINAIVVPFVSFRFIASR